MKEISMRNYSFHLGRRPKTKAGSELPECWVRLILIAVSVCHRRLPPEVS